LRQVVAQASPGDSVTFAPTVTGTITLTGGQIVIDKNLFIIGPGPTHLTISGNDTSRIFYVAANAAVSVSGVSLAHGYVQFAHGGAIFNLGTLTLTNATFFSNTAIGQGAGIYSYQGKLTLIDLVAYGNTAADTGGCVHNENGSLVLTNGRIYSNTYDGVSNTGIATVIDSEIYGNGGSYGGGVRNSGVFTLTNSRVYNNHSGGDGGGIYNLGSLLVTDSGIYSNTAPPDRYAGYGGGIYNGSGSLVLIRSEVYSNTASNGGGIYSEAKLTMTNSRVFANKAAHIGTGGFLFGLGGGLWNLGEAYLTGSEIYSNSTVSGGGISNYGALSLANSAVYSNTAYLGGGLFTDSPQIAAITNTTISSNYAGGGGGIYVGNYTPTLTLNYVTVADNSGGGISGWGTNPVAVSNSIIAANTGGNCHVTPISTGHNLDDGNSCALTATGDITNTDPLLGPLQDNGGSTWTHALLSGSPAINQIPFGVHGCGTTLTTDQRGFFRPIGLACDIGAYEYWLATAHLYLPIIQRANIGQ
jgi:hypothetical protein